MDNQKILRFSGWGSAALSSMLAVYVWGSSLNWHLTPVTTYTLFPLFGLIGFSLMWSHYITAALRIHLNVDKKAVATYFEVTSYAVLVAILLHPGLLIWQRWRDGYGLPPSSYLSYVRPGLKYALLLSSLSLIIFLAYELRRKYGKRPWWRYVQYASDAAILMIALHALLLGTNLQTGAFRVIWYGYAITLIAAIIYQYIGKRETRDLRLDFKTGLQKDQEHSFLVPSLVSRL